jgi:hypothetical protein
MCSPSLPPQFGRILVQPSLNFSVGDMTEHTAVHPHATQAIYSGSLLTLSCDLGFNVVGYRLAVCEVSGTYNATLGACVPIPCLSFSTLKLPPRAITVPASIRYLDTAIVTCESGYRFENGSAEISAWCDAYGNVSSAAPVPLCLRIPNFCEVRHKQPSVCSPASVSKLSPHDCLQMNPWACAVIVSWPFALAAAASLWFFVLQSVLVTVVLPSTGDQISIRVPRYKSLGMLPGRIRQKWMLLSDEFIL